MTVFINYDTLTFSEIYPDYETFLDSIREDVPSYIDRYIETNEFEAAYKLVLRKYKDRCINFTDEENFKMTFNFYFVELFEQYREFLNGNISKETAIENIGDTQFKGEQMTTIDTTSPFNTPKSTNSYTFNQKTGDDLVEELQTRRAKINEFLYGFNHLFQRSI